MYIYFNKDKPLRFLVRVDNSYNVRQENAGGKLYQDVIQLLQRQHKESSRLPDSLFPLPFRSSSQSFQPTPNLYVNSRQ